MFWKASRDTLGCLTPILGTTGLDCCGFFQGRCINDSLEKEKADRLTKAGLAAIGRCRLAYYSRLRLFVTGPVSDDNLNKLMNHLTTTPPFCCCHMLCFRSWGLCCWHQLELIWPTNLFVRSCSPASGSASRCASVVSHLRPPVNTISAVIVISRRLRSTFQVVLFHILFFSLIWSFLW